jgi:hypothetical protein
MHFYSGQPMHFYSGVDTRLAESHFGTVQPGGGMPGDL